MLVGVRAKIDVEEQAVVAAAVVAADMNETARE